MHSRLESVPYEVLVRIALDLACADDALGPPKYLPAFFSTSRTLAALASDALLARIFRAKFDTSAALRRLGPIALFSRNLASQLKTYSVALKRLRRGDVHSATLAEDLWAAYVMLLESDGRNDVHLREYARLRQFADALVRARLHENKTPEGWPVESVISNLAVWCLWMMTDVETMQTESHQSREELIALLLPYVTCCFRYNTFHAADIHYTLPLLRDEHAEVPHSVQTAHGPYPQYPDRNAVANFPHYGQRVTIAHPSLVQAAQLLYFARRELAGFAIPPGVPNDRTHALTLGQPTGPTRADYLEFNAAKGAKVLQWGDWNWREELSIEERAQVDSGWETFPNARALSARFDADWERLVGCYDPWAAPPSGAFARYARGAMVGRWVGRMLVPDENSYMSMIQNPLLSPYFSENFPFSTMRPIMFTLKEYHCISPEEPVDTQSMTNGMDEGVLNAYLPPLRMQVERDSVTFTDQSGPGTGTRHRYENVVPGRPTSHNEETCAYCVHRAAQAERVRRERMAEIEACFEVAGVGRSGSRAEDDDEDLETETDAYTETDMGTDMDVEEGTDAGMDIDADDNPADGWETTIEEGACNGVLDIAFTGLTEARHGDAWCHYMYYGRLRAWDGLIVLVGVPLPTLPPPPYHYYPHHPPPHAYGPGAQNDVNGRLWGKWIFRGYLHAGQNYTGRWRHYAYDLFSPAYEGAFTLSKRDD